MATQVKFREMTDTLGVENDCPVCRASWPMCHGLCVSHVALNGMQGPYHQDYSDDCLECKEEEAYPEGGVPAGMEYLMEE